MNHISSLMESSPPMQISTGMLVARERRAHEIAADRLAVLVGDLDDLAGRVEIAR